MRDSIYRIPLDVHTTSSQALLNVKKEDTGRRVLFTLMDGIRPYALTEDCSAVFRAQKPDGTILYNNCTIEDDVITYELTEQTSATVGIAECELTIYGADNKQLTSPRFAMRVEDNLYSDSEVESENEFTELNQAITETNNLNISASKEGAVASVTVTKKDGTTEVVTITDGDDGSDAYLWCEYGTTAYEDITAALADDKLPVCKYDGKLYILSFSTGRSYRFSSIRMASFYFIDCITNGSATTWTSENESCLVADDITQSLLNLQNMIPSSACVKTAVDAKVNASDLATVATSGSYNDLSNTPTIPTVPENVSAFTNDAGYLTEHQSLSAYRTSADQDTIDAGKISEPASEGTNGQVLTTNGSGGRSWATVTSGTTDYTDLTNKPQINSVELSGNKTLSQLGVAAETHTHTKSQITDFPTNVSAFTNDAGYITSVPTELYWCTYGTTTADDITAAIAAGKEPICKYDAYTFMYSQTTNTAHYFACTAIASSTSNTRRISCNLGTSAWDNETVTNERQNLKVTSLSASSTDSQYPSAKCVYDLIGDVETLLHNL